jgi:hypothetical protein
VLAEIFTGLCFSAEVSRNKKRWIRAVMSIVPRTWILACYLISSTAEPIRDGILKYIFITKESIGDHIHWVALANQVFKLRRRHNEYEMVRQSFPGLGSFYVE